MIFQQLFEPESSTYTYLFACPETRQAVLLDPVLETLERDLGVLQQLELTLAYTLETHIHADHLTSACRLRSLAGSKLGCPAADGEVIRAGDNGAAINPAATKNEIGWAEFGEVAMFIIAAFAGNLSDLAKAIRIKQSLQPFARVELALPVLPCELLLAPHFLRQRFTLAQMLDLSLPAHAIRIAGKRRALQARPPVVFI